MKNQYPLVLGEITESSDILPEVTPNNQVDARSLHEALEIATPFHMWISRRIEEYQFTDGEDYHRTNLFGNRHDYLLTLDTAKELAMVERNEAGRRVRRYFIEIEKRARAVYERSQSQPGLGSDALARIHQINNGFIQVMGEHAERIGQLEAATRPGPDWQTVTDWLIRRDVRPLNSGRIGFISRRCMEESGRRGLPIGLAQRKKNSGGSITRTYAPEVLDKIAPSLVIRWEARDVKEGYRHE